MADFDCCCDSALIACTRRRQPIWVVVVERGGSDEIKPQIAWHAQKNKCLKRTKKENEVMLMFGDKDNRKSDTVGSEPAASGQVTSGSCGALCLCININSMHFSLINYQTLFWEVGCGYKQNHTVFSLFAFWAENLFKRHFARSWWHVSFWLTWQSC